MDDRRSEEATETDESAIAGPEATAERINWLPTVVMLAILVGWILLAFVLRGRFPDQSDAARFVAYLLLAGVVVAAVPAFVRLASPRASSAARRWITVSIYLVVAIPFAFALFWSGYDMFTPVNARSAGELPAIGSLIGRSQHDVERILGDSKKASQAALPPGDTSSPARPGGADAKRMVVYALPDLNTLPARPQKRASQEAESKRIEGQYGSQVTPDQWGSDAVAIVYYDAKSRAVGARMDVSVRSAAAALSDVTSQSVLPAAGITPKLALDVVPAPVAGVAASTTPVPEVFWGKGIAGGRQADYRLIIGGLAGSIEGSTPSTGSPTSDRGDVTLVVASQFTDGRSAALANAAPSAVAQTQGGEVAPAEQDGQKPHGANSHSDQHFWAVICSPYYSDEEGALGRARDMNVRGRKNAGHFAVERTGHLDGLAGGDAWFVIYDVGYGSEEQAWKAAASSGLGSRLSGIRVVEVTKVCGDFTIADVVR